MNANTETDFVFSFQGFCKRGGETDKHKDGWGISFFEGKGVRTFLDSRPACTSPIANILQSYPVKTLNMISHIRYATVGKVCLENVHPFQREMWGINFCFAHNGDLPNFHSSSPEGDPNQPSTSPSPSPDLGQLILATPPRSPSMTMTRNKNSINDLSNSFIENVNNSFLKDSEIAESKRFTPVGNTDSEKVFCLILNSLYNKFTEPPTLHCLHVFLKLLVDQIVQDSPPESTIFNFLLCVGEFTQFAFCYPGTRPGSTVYNGLHYIIRKYPFNFAQLSDVDVTIDFSAVTTENDRVAVVATKPLTTDEDWIEMGKGELLLFHQGVAYSQNHDDDDGCGSEEARENFADDAREVVDVCEVANEPVSAGGGITNLNCPARRKNRTNSF